jgi:predicted TPR repeat methyltransferase
MDPMTPFFQDRYEEARALHRSGDLARAEALYREVLAAEPAHFRALNNLGAIYEALGRAGDAEDAYRRAAEAAPESAIVQFNLGRLLHLANRADEAEALYRRAVALDPGLAGAYFNLGRLLQERDRTPESEAPLRRTVELNPEGAAAQNLLGDALFAQQRMPEALAAYRRAAELAPDDGAAQFDVAKTLECLARVNEAIECYRRCVELDPDSVAGREGLARALHTAGRTDEALAGLREWAGRDAGREIAGHLIAALGGAEAPARAADEYVRETFDRFAADFDRTLERLGYRAPQRCAQALEAVVGAPASALAVLDAGCGTGLCGPLLAPWAARLEGVDLSAGMLARAHARGVYHALHEAELTAFLAASTGTWDAIVSADTFCYLGALEAPLAAAHAALRARGALVFTVEHDEDAGTYALLPHGRYAHAERYVRDSLDAAGFANVVIARDALRREGAYDVRGLVVTAVRPA